MEESSDIRDHLNVLNRIITQLLSVEIKIEEEDQAFILLASLLKFYETIVTTLLVGKETLTVDEVSTALLKTHKFKKLENKSKVDVLVVKSDSKSESNCGRSKPRGRSFDKDKS